MSRILTGFLRQLLPPACPLCKSTFPAGWAEPFCASCFAAIVPLPAAHCSCCMLPFAAADNSSHRCGRCLKSPPPFQKVFAVGCYQKTLQRAIQQFKFNRQVNLDRSLAGLLIRQLPADPSFDAIVPVPLHRRRLQQRSYNQSLLLAREIGRRLQMPVAVDLLQKSVATVAQHELSAKERERNLTRVFQTTRPLTAERILLVDDVMTTGSTVRACSQVLLAAGAVEVQVAIVARA